LPFFNKEGINMENCPHSGGDNSSCSTCGHAHHEKENQEEQTIQQTLQLIRHKILVMSGKGGVGKSSVAVTLALSLARRGYKVGLMDVDIHGPNVLRMLGLDQPIDLSQGQFLLPPEIADNLKVISIEVLMRNRDIAVIWRGPLKHQLIRQFLSEVRWGFLDYLVIDAPPGTGDEPMSVAQTIPEAQSIIVTTPQEISLADVRKSINFCQKIGLKILGIVENMSGYRCPHCGGDLPLFQQGGGERTAMSFSIPFLGALPFDPQLVQAADQGRLKDVDEAGSKFFQALHPMVNYIAKVLPPAGQKEPGVSIFAIPTEDGKAAGHFGQATQFTLITTRDQTIQAKQVLPAPVQAPGGIPLWLEYLGVTHVLTPGLGDNAQKLLQRKGMEVVVGVPPEDPEGLVQKYLEKSLVLGENLHPPAGSKCQA
jgi:Mrp family chromosome partitioning ATPase/predicted Fe-Mo cluster-binding NifX family protein